MEEAKIIKIRVRDRIAFCEENNILTAVNSGDMVEFDFDAEWQPESATATRTARFIYDETYVDIPFNGNICPLPSFGKAGNVFVGVFWGDLRSTTPAMLTFTPSILDGIEFPADPPEDVYNRIIALLNEKVNAEQLETEVQKVYSEQKTLLQNIGTVTLSPSVARYYLIAGSRCEIVCEDFSEFPLGYSASIVLSSGEGAKARTQIIAKAFKSASDNGMALRNLLVGNIRGGMEICIYKSDEEGFNWYLSSAEGRYVYMPLKGVDYYTEDDKAEFADLLSKELAKRGQLKPEFANSVGECSDTTKIYLLPDGYLYGYIKVEEEVNENVFDPSAALLNTRLSSTATSAQNGAYTTDYIPFDGSAADSLIVRLPSDFLPSSAYNRVWFADESNAILANITLYDAYSTSLILEQDENGRYYTDLSKRRNGEAVDESIIAATKYLRFSFGTSLSNLTSVDEIADVEILFEANKTTISRMCWANTGHAFVPADYENRIIAVEEQAEEIPELKSKVENLESGSNTAAVPFYWQSAVDSVVAKVRALQNEGGKDVVNFALLSDMHYGSDDSRTHNIGKLCRAVMDECDIPFAIVAGDIMSNDDLTDINLVYDCFEGAREVLAPIGWENLLLLKGNHDDVWGQYPLGVSSGEADAAYTNKVSPERMWNEMFRPQSKDLRRVFGGGTYFYIDNVPQKTRFVCLDSHFYDGEEIQNGKISAMTFSFGAEQLDWLENIALDTEYDVVIAVHVPPTAERINGIPTYLATISDGTAFRSIIAATAASIIGIFSGHCHADDIAVDPIMKCPVVTVTCASDFSRDADETEERTAGTANETAIDIVSINKASRTVNMTRLGIGNDRSWGY